MKKYPARKIPVPIDFLRNLSSALETAKRFEATIDLGHVYEPDVCHERYGVEKK